MTTTAGTDAAYDPYDVEINADPYPVFRRLREEAPLYRNETYDFYALSRFADVERGLKDRETYISGRGGILEVIKADMEMPPGVIIFEDPPIHTMHRGLLSRVFTPKKMNALEPEIRDFCARSLDPLVGAGGFDFVRDLGAQMPMRVIGMLLGIPDQDQEAIRDRVDADLRTEPGKPMAVSRDHIVSGAAFAEYVDWRAEHPSDDLMTQLLQAEFEDETGATRRLTREEVLTYVNVVAGAGNETTTRLIGWAGKVLAEHPDQRQELVEDRSLIPNAIEELLRYEPPAPHVARYVSRDVEHYGHTVPEGSVMMFLVGAANRDDRRFPDGDRFDIRRDVGQHLTFGYGIHFCLGAALARLEGRIALDEVLKRFPEWDVDLDNARLSPTSTVRGWETLPVVVAVSDGIDAFEIRVDDSVLDDLRERLVRVRLPDQMQGTGWEYGIPTDYLADLVAYWRDAYDWRAEETRLNELDHFRARLDGQSIHFIHARSPHAGALPLLLTHGWPGSVVEFLEVIPRLTDPETHGGDAADAFHVVAPSLPGYGFSEPTRTPGWDAWCIARAFSELMSRLDYPRYGAQGGDWGAEVATRIGALDAEHCTAIHLNMAIVDRPKDPVPLTDDEQAVLAGMAHFQREEAGYALEQGTKPQTVGVALNDSPAGLLAWIVEKFRAWSDCDGHPENAFTRDQLITNVMTYWLNQTITSSARLYWELMHTEEGPPEFVEVPTGIARYPKEVFRFPRPWVERRYNVTYWSELPRGGHFAAMEQPELFVDDVRAFFRGVR